TESASAPCGSEVTTDGSGCALRLQRLRHLRGRLPPQRAADEAAGVGDGIEIDAVGDAEAVQQIDHVLGADIAGRPPGVGAAAEPGHGGVEYGNAALHDGEDIGQRLAVGVVEVGGELLAGNHG